LRCGHRPFLRAPPVLECSDPAELWIAARAGDFTRPVHFALCVSSKAALLHAALQGAPAQGAARFEWIALRAPPALECSDPAELWIAARAGDFTRPVHFALCVSSKAALLHAALQGVVRKVERRFSNRGLFRNGAGTVRSTQVLFRPFFGSCKVMRMIGYGASRRWLQGDRSRLSFPARPFDIGQHLVAQL